MRSSCSLPGLRVVAIADPEALDEEPVLLGRWLLLYVVSAVIAREPRPAIAVTILNTEPGT
jgi:hypothetical protein